MNEARTSRTPGRHGTAVSNIIITAATTVAISLCGVMWSAAFAQSGSAPALGSQPPSDERYKAPIGHRQPRPQDLPPSVSRDEGNVSSSQRDLDRSLQICRNC